ncbi:glycosyltransferase [Natronoarchaeum sp. GCM10025703]|uniref:glycosyltransferase n=1 Tax=Natronoarchaeum sp. GCM10025703 TaxID=3252685 RepID=UPI00361EDD63
MPSRFHRKTVLRRGDRCLLKVFDAMAMGKPVIASDVSDLPIVLEGCGRIIKPGDVGELRESILALYNDPELCEELGTKARQRCVKKYSYNALAPVVEELVSTAYISA